MASATGDTGLEGGIDGTHVTVSGVAVKQSYDPAGATVDDPVEDTIALAAQCAEIEEPQAAPTVPPTSEPVATTEAP